MHINLSSHAILNAQDFEISPCRRSLYHSEQELEWMEQGLDFPKI